MKFTLESPEVTALLTGTYKCSPQTYFRVAETGKSFVYPIRKHLMALGMCSKTASLLLQRAELPLTPFGSNNREGANAPPPEKPAEKSVPATPTEEEIEEKTVAKEEVANSKRFQFITTNSGLFGVWDGTSTTVLSLFHDRKDAISELIRLKTGKHYAIDNEL